MSTDDTNFFAQIKGVYLTIESNQEVTRSFLPYTYKGAHDIRAADMRNKKELALHLQAITLYTINNKGIPPTLCHGARDIRGAEMRTKGHVTLQ